MSETVSTTPTVQCPCGHTVPEPEHWQNLLFRFGEFTARCGACGGDILVGSNENGDTTICYVADAL